MAANVYYEEKGRAIFVCWKPDDHHSDKLHRIAVLPSGDFEVVCSHTSLDEHTIRSQVRFIMETRKKNE